MTLTELYTLLLTTKLPVAYDHFPDKEKVTPPCITYNVAFSSNFGADNKMYSPFTHVDIHLYQKFKGEAESTLESVLTDNIFWNKTETWENDEKVYHTVYEVII